MGYITPYLCDHCGIANVDPETAIYVDDGTSKICVPCYRVHEKTYPHQRGVSYH